MNSNRLFYTKLGIGVASILVFIGGIVAKALWPNAVKPVLGDIDSLMILASGIFGGLVRDVLGFSVKTPETPSEPKP